MIQTLKRSSDILNYIISLRFLFNLPKGISEFLVDYLTGLMFQGLNALASELIDYLACWYYFSRISKYHSFVLTNMIVYFVVNMILLPGLTIASNSKHSLFF